MKTINEVNEISVSAESPLGIRNAIHEFSENHSHKNWIRLSKMLQVGHEYDESIRVGLLKGIANHVLSRQNSLDKIGKTV